MYLRILRELSSLTASSSSGTAALAPRPPHQKLRRKMTHYRNRTNVARQVLCWTYALADKQTDFPLQIIQQGTKITLCVQAHKQKHYGRTTLRQALNNNIPLEFFFLFYLKKINKYYSSTRLVYLTVDEVLTFRVSC